jgi:hypothetical protein
MKSADRLRAEYRVQFTHRCPTQTTFGGNAKRHLHSSLADGANPPLGAFLVIGMDQPKIQLCVAPFKRVH